MKLQLMRKLLSGCLVACWLLLAVCQSFAQLGAGSSSPGGPWSPAVLDAVGTSVVFNAPGTSVTFNNITVGTGANRALVVVLSFSSQVSPTFPTGITCNWDTAGTPQAMTQIPNTTASQVTAGGTRFLFSTIFGLVAPHSGNLTLVCSWTNSSVAYIDALSFTNVLQTGGAATFRNGTTATGLSQGLSVIVPSITGDFVVATTAQSFNETGTSPTTIYTSGAGAFSDGTASFTAGSENTTMSVTGSSSDAWTFSGVDVVHN